MDTFSTQHVSATSVLTAHMRALETNRPDALIDDPLAACLVEASGVDMSSVKLTAVTGQRIFESNVVRTRWLDDQIIAAVDRGCSQLVILGSGLDTRAARLELPSGTTVYEVDFPGVVHFKRSTFARENVEIRTLWKPVGASLTDSSVVGNLADAGFDATRATVWVIEGVLFYMSEAESNQLVALAAANSAPGSEFLAVHFGPGSQSEAQSREMNTAATASGFGFQSFVADPTEWLEKLGWAEVEATTIGRVGIELGRPIGYSVPETDGAEITWLIHARRDG